MEKEFVTYEIALALKELGFDEVCFGRYWIKEFQLRNPKNYNHPNEKIDSVSAPLWQQIISWFDNEHGLCIYWKPDRPNIGDTEYFIEYQFKEGIVANKICMITDFAREESILKAIEIIKNK